MRLRRREETGDSDIAELAALADGSLSPHRRAVLEARVAASRELADRLAEQKRAVALTRSAAAGVDAPAALRERVEHRSARQP
jgi:anti-sigma factor RsiW